MEENAKSVPTNLSDNDITQAKAAITAYRNTCDSLYKQLKAEIDNLVAKDFIGDAATGYVTFFNQITPAIKDKLIGTEDSITSMMEQLLNVVAQMMNPIDVQIGTYNQIAANGGVNQNG